MAYTGLRVSEVINLDCEDINLGERTLNVVAGKGDKDRMVIFANQTAVALRRWLERRDEVEHDALFLNSRGGRLTQRSVQRMVLWYPSCSLPIQNRSSTWIIMSGKAASIEKI